MCAPSELQFGTLRESGGTREVGCRGEPDSDLWGGDALDSVNAEGSSIVDEPGQG